MAEGVERVSKGTAVVSFGHDPEGTLSKMLGNSISNIRDIFGGISLVLSHDTLKEYSSEVSSWPEVVGVEANQKKQFRRAVERAWRVGERLPHALVIDFDRLLHAAGTNEDYRSELEKMAEDVQMADFTFCGRSLSALETHPMAVRDSEKLANAAAAQLVGLKRIDYFSGAYGVSSGLLSKFPFKAFDVHGPVYPIFVGTCISTLRKNGMKLQSNEYDCLSYETEHQIRNEIGILGSVSAWVQKKGSNVDEIQKRLEMANSWTKVFKERLKRGELEKREVNIVRQDWSKGYVVCSDGRHLLSNPHPNTVRCYESPETFEARKPKWIYDFKGKEWLDELLEVAEKDGVVHFVVRHDVNDIHIEDGTSYYDIAWDLNTGRRVDELCGDVKEPWRSQYRNSDGWVNALRSNTLRQ